MSQQQLQTIVQMLRSKPVVDPNGTVEEARVAFEQVGSMFPVDADITREVVSAGGVKAEWVSAPDAEPGRAVLYLHGGGYVIGSINTHRSLAARLARAAKAPALVIDYRLAPEHPHPAAVDDSVAAYRWILAQGLKPARIVVAGDSAGGGLAVATLVAIRDAKLPLPAAGACLSPWVDLEGIGESMTTKADADPIVQKPGLLRMSEPIWGAKTLARRWRRRSTPISPGCRLFSSRSARPRLCSTTPPGWPSVRGRPACRSPTSRGRA
jgi:acetyl esterase/lipase